jgi:hypothetical protein
MTRRAEPASSAALPAHCRDHAFGARQAELLASALSPAERSSPNRLFHGQRFVFQLTRTVSGSRLPARRTLLHGGARRDAGDLQGKLLNFDARRSNSKNHRPICARRSAVDQNVRHQALDLVKLIDSARSGS